MSWWILGGTWLAALLCIGLSARAARRGRLVRDLPTCSTAGVFIGVVELKGTAESERPLVSYLAEQPCVHYAWDIQEHWRRTVTETYTDKDGKTRTRTRVESGWTTVASGGDTQIFYLRDDDGVIRINPQGATLEPTGIFSRTVSRWDALYYGKGPAFGVPDSTGTRMFTESAIPLHAPIYVVGYARERDDVIAPEIVQHRDAEMYLISTRSEDQVRRGYAWQFWLLGVLGLSFAVGFWVVAALAADRGASALVGRRASIPGAMAASAAGYLLVWLLMWVWTAFNSLVGLRQRVRQAWANVDVHLKRRADLIPNLVRVVEGLRDHERTVQAQLAALRAQEVATRPGVPGPDPQGCRPQILAIVERYPELRSNQAFLALQRSLAETEQRIALARGYFNSIATFYNTRLQIIPDAYVASLARMRPQPLIEATGFERAPVDVKLSA